MFHVVHLALPVQQLGEDLPIGHNRPLGEENLPMVLLSIHELEQLLELLDPRQDGIDLEGEGPSLGLPVVLFQQIEAIRDFLPLGDGFRNDLDLRDVALQQIEESRLATADIALDRINSAHASHPTAKILSIYYIRERIKGGRAHFI